MKRFLAAAVLASLVTACGAPAPDDVLAETGENLAATSSGIIELRITVDSAGGDQDPVAGSALLGSFEWRENVPLPVVDITYSDLSPERAFNRRVVSVGDAVFVSSGGRFYEVPLDRADPDDSLGATDGLFAGTQLEDWVGDAQLFEGRGLDGRQIDRIVGRLRPDEAFTQLMSIVKRLPGAASLPVLGALDPAVLGIATESARIEVVSGSEDRQLRRLLIEVQLVEDPALARSRGWSDAASIVVDLGISEHNRPIEVQEPEPALPIEEMEGSWP